mgnify:FL=1
MEIQLWRSILCPYELAVKELMVKFEHIIDEHKQNDLYSPIEQVSGRVKSLPSILEKMQRKHIPMEKMEEEIEYRIHEVRKAALDDVKETRAQGDLSENFEYHAAKRFKNKNESRIRYLQRTIKNATVIDDSSADDEVGVNNTVEVLYEDDESTETIKIVTTIRADSLSGMISIESPLGKALLGHKKGDRVLVQVNPQVEYYVVIKSISNTDDSDDNITSY